jgi:hypothetical protein
LLTLSGKAGYAPSDKWEGIRQVSYGECGAQKHRAIFGQQRQPCALHLSTPVLTRRSDADKVGGEKDYFDVRRCVIKLQM